MGAAQLVYCLMDCSHSCLYLNISLLNACLCVQPMDDPERSLPFIAKILRTLRAEVCGPPLPLFIHFLAPKRINVDP